MHRNISRPYSGGIKSWRLKVIHLTAKALGLLIHVEGYPLGTTRNYDFKSAEKEHAS